MYNGILFSMRSSDAVICFLALFINTRDKLMSYIITVHGTSWGTDISGGYNSFVLDYNTPRASPITGSALGNGIHYADKVFVPRRSLLQFRHRNRLQLVGRVSKFSRGWLDVRSRR